MAGLEVQTFLKMDYLIIPLNALRKLFSSLLSSAKFEIHFKPNNFVRQLFSFTMWGISVRLQKTMILCKSSY